MSYSCPLLEGWKSDFADAALVLEDDFAITIEDTDHAEHRFVTLGTDPYARILVVVHLAGRNAETDLNPKGQQDGTATV